MYRYIHTTWLHTADKDMFVQTQTIELIQEEDIEMIMVWFGARGILGSGKVFHSGNMRRIQDRS